MRWMMTIVAWALALTMLAPASPAAARDDSYTILVTIDGLRWQEVFGGADPDLVRDARYRARFVDVPDRAEALMPFFQTFRREGAAIGNRWRGSCAEVSNAYWFSYPGYAELLSGRPNPDIRSNAKKINPDVTILEWVAQQPGFEGSVQAFAEWDTAPYILNLWRSRLPLFVADQSKRDHDGQVRDAARRGLEPPARLTWIALGDTDNRAHEGRYEDYLAAAFEADAFLAELWAKAQAHPQMAGRTTLIVATDHGRGSGRRWTGHGSGRWRFMRVPGLRHEGSEATFIGVRGPRIPAGILHGPRCASNSQIAATVLESLGLDWRAYRADAAPPLGVFEGTGAPMM